MRRPRSVEKAERGRPLHGALNSPEFRVSNACFQLGYDQLHGTVFRNVHVYIDPWLSNNRVWPKVAGAKR